jgi:hypothetical protein
MKFRYSSLPAMIGTIMTMLLTVFDISGVPGNRRECIKAAVVAAGRHVRGPHEAWIAADPFEGSFRVPMTGPQGFERVAISLIQEQTRHGPSMRAPNSRGCLPQLPMSAGGRFNRSDTRGC